MTTLLTFAVWCCFLYHVVANNGYYLSGGQFDFIGAHQFCQTLCDSQIVSIHTQQQQDAVAAALTIRDVDAWANNGDAYIGLTSRDYPIFNYEWTDDTGFNYGSDVSGGVSPWALQRPSTDDCVIAQQNAIGSWYDIPCSTLKRVVCSSCNGNLNKYAVIPVETTRDEAASACASYYGTQLASIHTDRDYTEAVLLSNITYPYSLWIGLNRDASSSTFQWDDDTVWQSASIADIACDSWNETVSFLDSNTAQCAALTADGCVDILDCDQQNYVLCNLPSELSSTLNQWNNQWVGNWVYDSSSITMSSVNTESEIVMGSTQWYNGDDPLYIEYTFSAQFQANAKLSGLSIYSRVGGSWCDWYFVAINRKQDGYYVSLRRGDNNVRTLLVSEPISVQYEENTPYTLSIEVTNGNEFVIGIDDVEQIAYIDNSSSWELVTNGLSGYISLWDFDDVNSTAHSLYISGSPIQVTSIVDMNSPIECNSAAPTANTESPTEHPTKEPTVSPTTAVPTMEIPNQSTTMDFVLLSSTQLQITESMTSTSSMSTASLSPVEQQDADTVSIAIIATVLILSGIVLVGGLTVYYVRKRKTASSTDLKRARTPIGGADIQPGALEQVASVSGANDMQSGDNDEVEAAAQAADASTHEEMIQLQPVKDGEHFERKESEGIYEPVEGDGGGVVTGMYSTTASPRDVDVQDADAVADAPVTKMAPGFLISTSMTQK